MKQYLYFDYEGMPCRVLLKQGVEYHAEAYHSGAGFKPAPMLRITADARMIDQHEFDAMVMALALQKKSE